MQNDLRCCIRSDGIGPARWAGMLILLCACLLANSILIVESQKDCEGNIPSRLEFGGSVAFEEDCVWRPQVHFISALSGKVSQPDRSLKAPIISLNTSLPLPSSISGPSKLVVNNVVLVNFTLSNPTKPNNPVLWPAGLLQPGWQAGTTLPRKLYLLDVRIFVQAETLQQYLQFFRYNSSATFYTDNATFLHVNYWNDERTLLQNVGLLLDVPGMSPLDMLGTKPPPGRNFVLGADAATLVPLLRGVAGVSTRVPFLVYLSSNVSLTARTGVGAGLPVNRQLFVVGKLTDITSIDFGMEVNQLVLTGSWSNITFSRVVLENLGPGDNRSAAISHNHDVQAGYNIWPVLFERSARRLSLNNVTLVLSHLDVEEFLYKATLYQIRPAGFTEQLQVLDSMVMAWRVTWQPASVGMLIMTPLLLTTSMSVLDTNYTTQPVIAPQVPLPTRYTVASSEASLQQALVQVNDWGLEGLGAAATGSQSELVLITTNLSFEGVSAPAAPGNQSPEQQLLEHLERNMQVIRSMRHILMGIVQPPVMLDIAYAMDLVKFPPGTPAGQLLLVSLIMNHLPQGPRASLPTASMLTADVWTILLWCFARPPENVIQMSNVTLWLPAGEFSFIRSHTKDTPTDFDVGLEGGVAMSFAGVVDLRADGLYVSRFKGPGIAGNSLTLRMELGWSMNGPPKGFWTTPASAAPAGGRLSDAMVTVLAVCLVTAFVASVLACLAIVFWRKRAAEARAAAAAAAAAAAELGKAGLAHTSSTGRDVDSSGEGGNSDGAEAARHRARSDLGMLSLLHMAPEVLDVPVHDSSNSYHHDRAALTQELARSQFVVTQLSGGAGQPAAEGSGSHVAGLGLAAAAAHGRPLLAPAASVPAFSTTSMASDAALHRLHSAITSMSQDVLSRRLAGAFGNGPGSMSALGKTSVPEALMHRGGGDAANADSAGAHQQAQEGAGGVDSPHALSAGNAGGPVPAAGAWAGALARAPAAADNHDGLALGSGGTRGCTAGKAAPAAPAQHHSVSSGSNPSGDDGLDQLKLLQLVGQGTFGQVYKALWRRRCVAVKVLQLPATAGSSDVAPWMGVGRASSHREKMAVMETVVSTTMSHPNIVQVYTYVLQPLMQGCLPSNKKQPSASSCQPKGCLPSNKKQPSASSCQPKLLTPPVAGQPDVQQQHHHEQKEGEQQQTQRQSQEDKSQRQFWRWQQRRRPQHALLAAAAHEQQQLQEGGVPLAPLPAAGTDSGSAVQQPENRIMEQVAQADVADGGHAVNGDSHSALQHQAVASNSPHCTQSRSDDSNTANCNDSSQSLLSVRRQQQQDIKHLTPEMAAAAAAALPAAAAAVAAAAVGNGNDHGSQQDTSSSGGSRAGDAGTHEAAGPGPVLVGWELRLVMEFCDAGSLRTALDQKLLIDRTTGLPALECVLFLAHDVACAMIHLHSEHLLHGDLKASNVLLKRTAPRLPVAPEAAGAANRNQARQLAGLGLGLMAKVADFGLSLTLGPAETHVSQMHMGTLTHMAPELLLHGRASKASDVYAYGILLWELATGRRPYSGTPVGMLAHKVAQQGWRPAWPGGASLPVRQLVEACWAQEAADRPCFNNVVQRLEAMASELDQLKQQQAQQMAAAAAPLCALGASGNHPELELGHELTPSMMEDLMPSGFSAGSNHSGLSAQGEELQLEDSGILYEMSQLSGGSQPEQGPVHPL